MNDYEKLNDAIKKLNEKTKQTQKFIPVKPLIPGKDPTARSMAEMDEMEKAYKESSEAFEEVRKIWAALTKK